MKLLNALVAIWLGFFALVGWLATIDLAASMGALVMGVMWLTFITLFLVKGNS